MDHSLVQRFPLKTLYLVVWASLAAGFGRGKG